MTFNLNKIPWDRGNCWTCNAIATVQNYWKGHERPLSKRLRRRKPIHISTRRKRTTDIWPGPREVGNGRCIARQPFFFNGRFFPSNFPELPHMKPRFPAAEAEGRFVSILSDLFRCAANIVFTCRGTKPLSARPSFRPSRHFPSIRPTVDRKPKVIATWDYFET